MIHGARDGVKGYTFLYHRSIDVFVNDLLVLYL
jgi:hypothetical protein